MIIKKAITFLRLLLLINQEPRGKPARTVREGPREYELENPFKNSRHPDSYRDGEPARRSGGLDPQ